MYKILGILVVLSFLNITPVYNLDSSEYKSVNSMDKNEAEDLKMKCAFADNLNNRKGRDIPLYKINDVKNNFPEENKGATFTTYDGLFISKENRSFKYNLHVILNNQYNNPKQRYAVEISTQMSGNNKINKFDPHFVNAIRKYDASNYTVGNWKTVSGAAKWVAGKTTDVKSEMYRQECIDNMIKLSEISCFIYSDKEWEGKTPDINKLTE